MTRQGLDLPERDLMAVADVMDADVDELRRELERRPWYINDVLRHPAVVEAVIEGTANPLDDVSPLLFFAVIAHQAAQELTDATWVADWTGPRRRLPVFDVEPLLEFADDPGRLVFTARLLAGFATPEPAPVPADHFRLDELAAWVDVAEPHDRVVLLRRLGDLALFQAGVFPDATGARALAAVEADQLGRSAGFDTEALLDLIDPASPTPGLDALEILGAAWYQAAAAESDDRSPGVRLDIAARIRPARRFLNHVTDRYLGAAPAGWAFAC